MSDTAYTDSSGEEADMPRIVEEDEQQLRHEMMSGSDAEEEEDDDDTYDPSVPNTITLMSPRSSNIKGATRRTSAVKVSPAQCIVTGRQGGAREQHIEVRSMSTSTAGTPRTRRAIKTLDASFRSLSSGNLMKTPDRGGGGGDSSPSLRRPGRLQVQQSTHAMLHAHNKKKIDDPEPLKPNAEEDEEDQVVYRLEAKKTKKTVLQRLCYAMGISLSAGGIYDDGDSSTADGVKCCGYSPNNMVTNYLHWSFRSSFLVFVLSGALVFFALTLIFALLMWVVGQYEPHCIHVNGQDFGDEVGDGNEFSDAFALSWTTFSTVGYGLVFPSSSATSQRPHECIGLQMLCTLEAFVGILFASMCGAILFGKVGRVRSQAQVIFSDPMVIRYGTGVLIGGDDSMSSNGGGNASGPIWLRTPRTRSSGDIPPPPSTPPPPPPPSMSPRLLSNRRFLPCPVLEFRVVNRLHNSLQGEIIDASMSIIASIDEDQARAAMEGLSKRGRRRRGRIRGVRMQHGQPTIKEARALGPAAQQRVDDSLASLAARVHERARQRHQAFVEDNDGFLVNRRVFVKLDVETPDHPFFKRVWILKHELNENSPLLSAEARRAVKLNQSFWPQELNSYSAVRDAIQFDQILVSLSGTSNADANSVYAQKIYRHSDVNVGWRFVNLLYRDELDGGTVRVDHRKINDVVEQAGGGGEPFMNPEESERNDLATIPI